MDYADPEVLLVAWVDADPGPEQGATKLPPSFVDDDGAVTPLVQVMHYGGADDLPAFPNPSVDFTFYAVGQGAASALARKWHHKIRFDLRGQILTKDAASATVTAVSTIFLPRPDYTFTPPTDVPTLFRYLASYAITLKTRTA